MQGQTQGNLKYPRSTLIRSSDDLGWSAISADLRSHGSGDGPGAPAASVEVAITVNGADDGLVACKVVGQWEEVRPATGTIWLNPVGAQADEICIASPDLQVLHLYVPDSAFHRLNENYSVTPGFAQSIRYASGVQDEVIRQVGLSVLQEMENPSAGGRVLVETSSLFVAARLMHAHADIGPPPGRPPSQGPLDDVRLARVLEYIETHLTEEITLSDLAEVACLSAFHFIRAFASATGKPPHRYLSLRRLEVAKSAIAAGRQSLVEIALDSRFSSQSSFTRAFRRATGITPASYRRRVR